MVQIFFAVQFYWLICLREELLDLSLSEVGAKWRRVPGRLWEEEVHRIREEVDRGTAAREDEPEPERERLAEIVARVG